VVAGRAEEDQEGVVTSEGYPLTAAEVHRLALYNAERSRGVAHTPDWQEQMADLQRRFDEVGWTTTRGEVRLRTPFDTSWIKMECVCCGRPEHAPWYRRLRTPTRARRAS
jgi:hypothetical protein